MARRKMTQDETQERFQTQLEKAKEALQTLETRLSQLDKEREKLTAKIKERKAEVEKYQALIKEKRYSVFEETLRLKGLNLEDVTRAIANGDAKYLLELSNRKAEIPVAETEPKTEKTAAYTPAPQNENIQTRPEFHSPNYPPQPVNTLRPESAGIQARPLNITQYGQAPARPAATGRNAAQPQA